ncbi:MAG: transketolase [Clostridiales bacterium]|nr:transketolase [Clostridiales bacterium]
MANPETVRRLKELAYQQRVRLITLCGAYNGPVHIGGDMSMTDVLVALYHYGMNVDPQDIALPSRDRFVLSKGHAAVCMYIAMSLRGFFDFDKILESYCKVDTAFGMHPCKVHLPGVECSSGSLGQGISMAVGMALMARQRGESHRVFCMMGDGETCEGVIWEAAMYAGSRGLGNLVGIVDRNRQFMTHYSDERFIKLEPYAQKWRDFGWNALEIDGHDMSAIVDAIDRLPPASSDRPTMLVCDTVKGKGVSFMERNIDWHAGNMNAQQVEQALRELKEAHERDLQRGAAS